MKLTRTGEAKLLLLARCLEQMAHMSAQGANIKHSNFTHLLDNADELIDDLRAQTVGEDLASSNRDIRT